MMYPMLPMSLPGLPQQTMHVSHHNGSEGDYLGHFADLGTPQGAEADGGRAGVGLPLWTVVGPHRPRKP